MIEVYCNSDSHEAVPLGAFRHMDGTGLHAGWTFRAVGPRVFHRAGTGTTTVTEMIGSLNAGQGVWQADARHELRCPRCGDNLQIGKGRWGTLCGVLDGLAAHLESVPLSMLRKAYAVVVR